LEERKRRSLTPEGVRDDKVQPNRESAEIPLGAGLGERARKSGWLILRMTSRLGWRPVDDEEISNFKFEISKKRRIRRREEWIAPG
jgi:hypothetical protein